MPRLDELQTPALLIRMDRVRHNVATMLARCGGAQRWRPHVKTAKVGEVLDLLFAAGVTDFKCATTKEARVLLARAPAPIDLLVAFAHRGPNLAQLADLAALHPRHRVSVLSEDPEHVRDVRAASQALGVWIDVDPQWHRSGIPLNAPERIAAVAAAAGASLRGVHCYDGHVRDADPDVRRRAAHAIYAELLNVLTRLRLTDVAIVTSGTPSFEAALAFPHWRDGAHAVSPGTVVYWDATSEGFGIRGFAPAVHVLARVTSASVRGRITVDAGSKALDAAAGDPCAFVDGWPGLDVLHPSEEHLPIAVRDGAAPALGALLQLWPVHVCPTVNLADEAVLLEGDVIVGVVPVHARGHDTLGPARVAFDRNP